MQKCLSVHHSENMIDSINWDLILCSEWGKTKFAQCNQKHKLSLFPIKEMLICQIYYSIVLWLNSQTQTLFFGNDNEEYTFNWHEYIIGIIAKAASRLRFLRRMYFNHENLAQ